MSMFGPKMGTWRVHSEEDSRWNCTGRAKGLVCQGGPAEMQDWIKQCKATFGDPPKDASMMFMKD